MAREIKRFYPEDNYWKGVKMKVLMCKCGKKILARPGIAGLVCKHKPGEIDKFDGG